MFWLWPVIKTLRLSEFMDHRSLQWVRASVFHGPILKLQQVGKHTDNSDSVGSHFSQRKPIIWIKMDVIIYPGWTHPMFTCMLWFGGAHTHWGCCFSVRFTGAVSVWDLQGAVSVWDLQGQFQCEVYRGSFSVRFTGAVSVWDLQGQFQCEIYRGSFSVRFTGAISVDRYSVEIPQNPSTGLRHPSFNHCRI